jgi:hypothetical protein
MPEGECGTVAQLPVSPRCSVHRCRTRPFSQATARSHFARRAVVSPYPGLFGHADASLPPVSREKEELAAPSQALQP